ncbi:RNA-binding protein Raly isoform X1 [Hippocampus comes]|uniref:RALY heterogeneous nuclear ribonucleoprotein n=1 Tax=Hippocampus comes TaxID=109280 RepID=A0A3Q2XXF7_HIPCM|nr:PREDICTED: RNA-binding protein Raly-like isoform X1 [Hippocampus comes]
MSLPVPTSNVTNKRDAKSIKSRVFIGNLNTTLVSKRDVESVFSEYGRVTGCSVHKGYAFVQYANRGHALAAVAGHDGRVLAGQTLDINMAGEPKVKADKATKRPIAPHYHLGCHHLNQDLYDRLFDFHRRASPLTSGVVPVKWPRVSPPVVRRLSSLPAQLLPQDCDALRAGATEGVVPLQVIKSQLTQIKANIDALLGRLEHITQHARATDTVQEERTRSRQRGGNEAHEEEEREGEKEEGRGEGKDDRDRALTECVVVDQLANRKLVV